MIFTFSILMKGPSISLYLMCPESVIVNASFNCFLYLKTENLGLSNPIIEVNFGDNSTRKVSTYSYSE